MVVNLDTLSLQDTREVLRSTQDQLHSLSFELEYYKDLVAEKNREYSELASQYRALKERVRKHTDRVRSTKPRRPAVGEGAEASALSQTLGMDQLSMHAGTVMDPTGLFRNLRLLLGGKSHSAAMVLQYVLRDPAVAGNQGSEGGGSDSDAGGGKWVIEWRNVVRLLGLSGDQVIRKNLQNDLVYYILTRAARPTPTDPVSEGEDEDVDGRSGGAMAPALFTVVIGNHAPRATQLRPIQHAGTLMTYLGRKIPKITRTPDVRTIQGLTAAWFEQNRIAL